MLVRSNGPSSASTKPRTAVSSSRALNAEAYAICNWSGSEPIRDANSPSAASVLRRAAALSATGSSMSDSWPKSSISARLRSSCRALKSPSGPVAALTKDTWRRTSSASRTLFTASTTATATSTTSGTASAAASFMWIGMRRLGASARDIWPGCSRDERHGSCAWRPPAGCRQMGEP